ncbi:MAG: PEPxxWA-CTERM sorting domain-containing protein [Caulobacteraceae bacterium]
MAAALSCAGAAGADTFFLNYEAPTVQTTTATFSVSGVETFDSLNNGIQSFTTDFGTGGAITGVYTGVQIKSADKFGGAGGAGKYAVAFAATPYSVVLTADPIKDPQGINYYGYWLSALDAGNQVEFLKNGNVVGALDPGGVLAKIGNIPAYFGNPNPPFKGENSAQPYVFINFYDTNGTFDEVRFFESPNKGGYESDNHTVGFYTHPGGVPEPASWALMIVGLGLAGLGMRRGREAIAAV